jgi:hypothetical protein
MLLAFVVAGVFDVIDSPCPMLLIGVVDDVFDVID